MRFSYPLRLCIAILKGINLHVSIIYYNPILRANNYIDQKWSIYRVY